MTARFTTSWPWLPDADVYRDADATAKVLADVPDFAKPAGQLWERESERSEAYHRPNAASLEQGAALLGRDATPPTPGRPRHSTRCPTCDGAGMASEVEECVDCDGYGHLFA